MSDMFAQFKSARPPYCLARMNEYVAVSGNDLEVQVIMSNGASDCIIFVCHNPTHKRALLCHVDRNTDIERLITTTHSLVTGGDFAGCNIYLISGVFCAQNYTSHGIYTSLNQAIGPHPVETIAVTAYALNVGSGKMTAGSEASAMCSQFFPDAATTGGAMFAMIPSKEAASCVYKSKSMSPLTGGRPRASSGGSITVSKKKFD